MGDDEVLQKLWECDENLCRAELTDAQRAKFTAERKKWYEIKYPETRRGNAGAEAKHGRASAKLAFADETAKATGRSKRSVQRDALRGAKIDLDALEILEGTIGDKGVNLDAIARLDPEDQVKAARLAAQGKPFKMAPDPRNDFEAKEAQVSRLMSAWNAASREAREDFLARIDRPVFDSTRAA